jgi:hypothetical protein
MDEFATQLLKASMLGSLRQDEIVARQGVMNHQTAAHLMDLSFVRDATEMSIPESYAVQGLSMSQAPREAQALNLADRTPVEKS